MKKVTVFILSIIALAFTFFFAEIFNIYHFGSIPTLLTSLYLISFFSIFDYLTISIIYIIRKMIKKEKLKVKKIIALVLLFIALLLILIFLVVVNIDYLNWYAYSIPFYLNVIYRSIEFLLPSIIFVIISFLLIKSKKER